MSRKTYSLSAAALVAIAGFSFSSVDGAVAFAQAASEEAGTEQEAIVEEPIVQSLEVMPVADDAVSFVSNPVSQTLPEPVVVDAVEVQDTPVQTDAGSLRELVGLVDADAMTEQMRCLAGAVYFESRGEPLAGQLAVAQVVINRSEDRRWPASYCGVVYQRAQFSFVKGGRMPNIRTSTNAWKRATSIAKIAHEGLWESEAADAVYFHAKAVRPKWSRRKQRTAQINSHIFYR